LRVFLKNKYIVDSNGIIKVSAKDLSTGSSENITIKNDSNRLTDEEIKIMLEKSKQMQREDRKVIERITAKNALESFLFQMDGICKKNKGKIKKEDKANDTILDALDWMESRDDFEAEDYEKKLRDTEEIILPILRLSNIKIISE
jgi:molecular chaperone DnaK (HSP70)